MKTLECKFFAQGKCVRGESCSFNHHPNSRPSSLKPTAELFAPSTSNLSFTTYALNSKPNKSWRKKLPCRFFASGSCKHGDGCAYGHLTSAATSAGPSSETGTPDERRSKEMASEPANQAEKMVPCRFYSQGYCRSGAKCRFEHVSESGGNSGLGKPASLQDMDPVTSSTPDPNINLTQGSEAHKADNHASATACRYLRGANVIFTAGAEVSDLDFNTDYSAVQLSALPLEGDAVRVQEILTGLGEKVPLHCIRIKVKNDDPSISAVVTVNDPHFAQRVLTAHAQSAGTAAGCEITLFRTTQGSETAARGLQLNSVTCTWYKPSRIAWLHYHSTKEAVAGEKAIKKHAVKIYGRKLDAELQLPDREDFVGREGPIIKSIRLGNLDVGVSKSMIWDKMPKYAKPVDVVLGKASYATSSVEPEASIKKSLQRFGDLESFDVNPNTGATKMKAMARFRRREDARRAIAGLNGERLQKLRNSKLFVAPIVSVKLSILVDVYSAIRGELDDLKAQEWETAHVQIKSYPPSDPSQRYIVVRIFGENAKSVARIKSAFEIIMSGTIARKGQEMIWDECFAAPSSIPYLKGLSRKHTGFVYRDMRKHCLALYGSPESKDAMQAELIAKLMEVRRSTHIIPLNPAGLRMALEGGFRRIVDMLGKEKATLDVTKRRQVINITGSDEDFEIAQRLLQKKHVEDDSNVGLSNTVETLDCVVCWTEAEDAYRTRCGHHYCTTCFQTQCHSASETEFPLRCLGKSGACSKAFELEELQSALSSAAFEQVLDNSLVTYVRTNPKTAQYCPTPDCQQVYRVSADGTTIDCSACLTPICTTCQTIAHDGLTCADYKEAQSDGGRALKKWKAENGVRDCPICAIGIEKTYGCDHMECMNCKAHICWACMETFKSGSDCYGHLQKVHDSFYPPE